jgi:hypothetical protein
MLKAEPVRVTDAEDEALFERGGFSTEKRSPCRDFATAGGWILVSEQPSSIQRFTSYVESEV